MLYAASILRMLAARHADQRDGRLHRFVLFGVAILEAATYGYMSWLYEHPSGVAWALIGARALAAPLLSVYLSLARPLPVMARDMLALGERISGEGVLRDLARIAGDASAPLAEKVALYLSAALIAPDDETRLRALLTAAQDRLASAQGAQGAQASIPPALPSATLETPEEPPQKPPTGPGSPARKRRVRNPRKKAGKLVALRNPSVEERAAAAWQPGMSIPALEKAAGISRASAQKYAAKFSAQQTREEMPMGDQQAQ